MAEAGFRATARSWSNRASSGSTAPTAAAGGAIQSNDPLTVDRQHPGLEQIARARRSRPTTKRRSRAARSSSTPGSKAVGPPRSEGSGPVTLADSIIAANRDPNGTAELRRRSHHGHHARGQRRGRRDLQPRRSRPRKHRSRPRHPRTARRHDLRLRTAPRRARGRLRRRLPADRPARLPRPRGAACDSGPFELEPTPSARTDRPRGIKPSSILIGGGKVQVDGHGFGRVRLTCPASEQSPPCSGTAAVEDRDTGGRLPRQVRRPVAFAKAKFKLGAGKTKKITVHLGSEKADLIRVEPRSRRVLAMARVADAAGNHGVAKRHLRLVPAKKR